VLKSAGRMVGVDQERVIRSAEESIKGVLTRTAQRH